MLKKGLFLFTIFFILSFLSCQSQGPSSDSDSGSENLSQYKMLIRRKVNGVWHIFLSTIQGLKSKQITFGDENHAIL